jgi:hypothetical protein
VGLYFENRTPTTVWVVYGYPNLSCGSEGTGVQYSKKGWFFVTPGTDAKVHSGWVGGHAWFYYAESDGGLVWSGDYFTTVPDDVFDNCWGVGIGGVARNLGFRRVRPSAEIMDFTVSL